MNKPTAKRQKFESEEMMDIFREQLYGTSDYEHPEYKGLFDSETCQIAYLISKMTIRDLADMARAFKIIAKGKVVS